MTVATETPQKAWVPPGHTEEQVIAVIAEVARQLGKRLCFGPHTQQDIEQEIAMTCLEVLLTDKFDPQRNLKAFLLIHSRNRLLNKRRKEVCRTDSPCRACQHQQPHQPSEACEKYKRWQARQERRRKAYYALPLDKIDDEKERQMAIACQVEEDVEIREVLDLIDEALDVETRRLWLQLRAGVSLPTTAKKRVLKEVKAILEEAGVELPEGLEL
jgi:hypothetical protein